MALKSAQIVDLCRKSSGFVDFENTADRGSAVILGADSRLCLSYVRTLGPKRNLDPKSFFSLDRYVKGSSKFFLFFGLVLCCCYQARCLLYYFGKINSGIHMH